MNKPETKPAQSLEEILTSIRKALAEEEVQGDAESPSPAGPAPATDEQPAPAKGDPLSGQLAVALNGSGAHEAAPDDDLADLLAPAPSKGASPASVEPEPSEPGEKKDPLWFLAPKPAAESEPALKEEPLPRTGGDDAKPAPEELKLTRLETLRASLPPLFGADAEERAEIKAEPINFMQPASPRPATLADFGAPEKGKDEEAEAKAALPNKVPQPEKASVPPVTRPELATPLPTPPPPASVVPAAEAMASALTEPRRNAVKGSPAATAQARALEEMIGQLLEPVIRNWLEANLPRLVEKVVREEVARSPAPKSDAAKD
jgi:hypothetical protein